MPPKTTTTQGEVNHYTDSQISALIIFTHTSEVTQIGAPMRRFIPSRHSLEDVAESSHHPCIAVRHHCPKNQGFHKDLVTTPLHEGCGTRTGMKEGQVEA